MEQTGIGVAVWLLRHLEGQFVKPDTVMYNSQVVQFGTVKIFFTDSVVMLNFSFTLFSNSTFC